MSSPDSTPNQTDPSGATAPLPASRRALLTGALTGGAALAAAGYSPAAWAEEDVARGTPGRRVRVTVLGTTDLHGNVYNWDYFKNAEFDNKTADDIGLAKVATLVKGVRAQVAGKHPVLTLDAGDTIQGTPLAYYYAKVKPIGGDVVHPMATAMNLVGYDAAALGNHEFNYGIPLLRTFQDQLDFPLLGANAVDPATKRPAFPPYVIKRYKVGRGRTLTVGVLGLTNPGIAIWDKANVEGQMEFPGLVEQAKKFVPVMKKKGCDLVIVSAHSGADTSSSYGDALPFPENAASLVAEEVPDVDAILVGHAHKEIAQRFVRNAKTGQQVLLCEPAYWGMRLAVMDFVVQETYGRKGRLKWVLVSSGSQVLNSNTVEEDAEVAAALRAQHDVVVDYVNSVVGTSLAAMSGARAMVEDSAIMDFVHRVQAETVKKALTGADAALPVLSISAPFSRSAMIPEGEVTVRDIAGLYIYDNTLFGVKMTGKQIKDYLEFSARYFKTVTSTTATIAELTQAVTDTAPNGTPDYNYDMIGGLDARFAYDIDVAQPVGSRIKNVTYDGAAVTDDQMFVLAINNYRQSGGGSFPHAATAPTVTVPYYEIRQLLIDWVAAEGTIDPAQFASVDWRLVANGEPITITG